MSVNESQHNDLAIVSDQLVFIFKVANYGIICQILAVVGCVTNVINMVVFRKIGFKDTINLSLFGLAVSDFGSCFTVIWVNIAMNPWFQQLDLPLSPVEVQYLVASWPHVMFTKITILITAFIGFERCLCVAIPLKVKTIITRRRVKIFLVSTYLILIAALIPIYYTNRFSWKYYPTLNRSLLGLVFTEDREDIEAVYFTLLNVFGSFLAFIFISTCTAVLVVSLRRKLRWRQSVTATPSNELSSKEKKVAKMVINISSLFIVCFLPTLVFMTFMTTDSEIAITGAKINLLTTFGAFNFTLEALNSAINTFIYYHNSFVFREKLNQIVGIRGTENGAKDSKRG